MEILGDSKLSFTFEIHYTQTVANRSHTQKEIYCTAQHHVMRLFLEATVANSRLDMTSAVDWVLKSNYHFVWNQQT